MPDTVAEPARRGRTVDAKDREERIELLIDSPAQSPDPVVEKAWRIEVRRRIAAYGRSTAVLYDADEVVPEAKLLAP